MSKKEECPTPPEHHLHMCQLRSTKVKSDIDKLADNPTVVCTDCGAKANKPENLCAPKAL